ncbi:hypothetical protein ACFVRB_42200 [Streptomyces nojiriensis]|uniref:hypothetical protein n=1 Tax=Streptomyces nojiriensis TaxID=66374 RepID=UPI0036DDCF71
MEALAHLNPGSGFVGNQYVMDLRTPAAGWPCDGTSPWSGLSGAAVFCDRYLTGVVASDRQHSDHSRLNVVPSYVLHHDPAFRTTLADHGGGPQVGLEAVEFQDLADPTTRPTARPAPVTPAALLEAGRQTVPFHGRDDLVAQLEAWCGQGGFGAWLLHGPGGQGKTRLAHHLSQLLTAQGWTVLWPRASARPDQLTALVEAAAEHPGTSPFKNLLAKRAKALHLGPANYCWFLDPSKALCLKLAGAHARGATEPLISMCDSGRCPQATHHAGHRPVWAASAESKKVFIATIGRAQRTEKARLSTELARDERVLAEIDALCGTGA